MKTLSVTSLTFSAMGDQLLVNLGGEQLYLYDFVTHENEHFTDRSFKFDSYKTIFANEIISDEKETTKLDLTPEAELLKQKANSFFEAKNYVEAVEFYNQAIEKMPHSAVLFGNRAAALMKRGW